MKAPSSLNLTLAISFAVASLTLGGCGLAETSAVAAAQGGTAAEQAAEAKKTQEKVEQGVAAADQAAADARAKADEEAGQ
jgi:hypothetical protein